MFSIGGFGKEIFELCRQSFDYFLVSIIVFGDWQKSF